MTHYLSSPSSSSLSYFSLTASWRSPPQQESTVKLKSMSVSLAPATTEPPVMTWLACTPVSVFPGLPASTVSLMWMSVPVSPARTELSVTTWWTGRPYLQMNVLSVGAATVIMNEMKTRTWVTRAGWRFGGNVLLHQMSPLSSYLASLCASHLSSLSPTQNAKSPFILSNKYPEGGLIKLTTVHFECISWILKDSGCKKYSVSCTDASLLSHIATGFLYMLLVMFYLYAMKSETETFQSRSIFKV